MVLILNSLKVMLKKILKITGITIALLMLSVLAAPFLFKGKIIRAVKNYAATSLNAGIDFSEDVQISLFRDFPKLSLGLSDVRISGVDSFAQDTLFRAKQINLSMNLMSLFGSGPVEVSGIMLDHPDIYLKVLESGRANWDIVKPDSVVKPADTAASKFRLALKKLDLNHARIDYDDRSLGFRMVLKDVQHELSGDFTAERFVLRTLTSSPDFTLQYGGVSWLQKVQTRLKADLDMDMKEMRFAFREGTLALNALTLAAEGFVDMNDADMEMDLKLKAREQDFKSFLSIIPGMYRQSFKQIQSSGKLECAAFVKGKYSEQQLPAYQAKLQVQDGYFRYPDLPYAAEQIQLALQVYNPDGLTDHTRVDLNKLHMVLAGKALDASMLLQNPVSNPDIRAALKGELDLGRFSGLIPLEAGTKLSGLIRADLAAAGRYAALQAGEYESFNATGNLELQQLNYSSTDFPKGFLLQTAKMEFTPRQFSLPVCEGSYGSSDFSMKGSLQQFIGYALGKSKLLGSLNLSSRRLNVNEFLTESAPAEPVPADTLSLTAVVLPRDLTLDVAMQVDQLIYDNLSLEKVRGVARLDDGRLDLSGVQAGLMGGTIALDGAYDSRNSSNPAANLTMKLTSLSIPEGFNYFPLIRKFAPVARYAKGLFSADVSFSSVFSKTLKPNYRTMDVEGVVRVREATVEQLDIIKKLSSQLNVPVIQSFDLKNQKFAFSINQGVFSLKDSLDVNLPGGILMKLGGGSLFDESLRYGGRMLVPSRNFQTSSPLLAAWKQEAAKKGMQLTVPERLPVDFSVAGTLLQPKVSVALRTAASQAAADLKEQAKRQLEQQRAAAEQRAKDSLERLRIRGEQEAERLKREAVQKLEQEKQAAEARLQEEKRKAEEEAKRRLEAEKQKVKQQLKDKLKQSGGGGN